MPPPDRLGRRPSLLAKTLNYPLVGHWRDREALLLPGLKASPDSVALQDHESTHGLKSSGQMWPLTPSPRRPGYLNAAL